MRVAEMSGEATTLADVIELIDRYRVRWEIEMSFNVIKILRWGINKYRTKYRWVAASRH